MSARIDEYRVVSPYGIPVRYRVQSDRYAPSDLIESQYPGLYYKPTFEPREGFSASQISDAESCEAAWGFRNLWGLRDLEIPYHEIAAGREVKPKQRGASIGTAMHGDAESYYTTGTFDESTDHGRALYAGLHMIPQPNEGDYFEIECGLENFDSRQIYGGIEPVRFTGYKDLVHYSGPLVRLYDWKGTADFKYAKTVAQLLDDGQSNLYALDIMTAIGANELHCQWTYFRTRGVATAQPVRFAIQLERAREVVAQMIIKAVQLRQHIRNKIDPNQLDKNPDTCEKFGKPGKMNCPYHYHNGGPCDGGRGAPQSFSSFGDALLQLGTGPSGQKKEENNMIDPATGQEETLVARKIREAREAAAAARGQAPAGAPPAAPPQPPAAAPSMFAPPPAGGYMAAPGTPPPAPTAFAPPPLPQPAPQAPPMAPPAAPPPPPPIASHVLPPEASAAPPPPPLAPPVAAPALPAAPATEPAKRTRGPNKPKAGGVDKGVTPGTVTYTATLELGTSSLTITSESAEELTALVPMVFGPFQS